MRLFMASLFLTASLLAPCAHAREKIKVVSSIKPLSGLTRAIGREYVTVETILSTNNSEHVYQLKPQDMANIESADLIFWVGPALETYLKKPLKNSKSKNIFSLINIPNLITYKTRQGLEWPDSHNHKHEHDALDAHIWLDPNNALTIITFITKKLSEIDPTHAKNYEHNAHELSDKIIAFDKKTISELSQGQNKNFLVFHDGYQYFEKHYHLKAAGAISLGHDQGLTPKNIEKILTMVNKNQVSCLFIEPGQEAPIIEKIAREKHIYLGQLDPMGSLLPDDQNHYLNMLEKMKDSFRACFTYKPEGDTQ